MRKVKIKNVYQSQEYTPSVDNSRQDANHSHGSYEAIIGFRAALNEACTGFGALSHSCQVSQEWNEGELNDGDEEEGQILVVLIKDEAQEAGEHANASNEDENTSTYETSKRKTCRRSGAFRSNGCGDARQRLLGGEKDEHVSTCNLASKDNICGRFLSERPHRLQRQT
jgi:hypothetical protein